MDTRTDIYSLGVILYRLVTGTLPFTTESLENAADYGALHALQSLICETEPPRPSTRVTTSNEISETLARVMGTQSSTLVRRLRGDLDWIVLKSLEKDRNRRYATAADFAEDIRRHLESEPVKARPPSTAYRLRKLVRKNAGLVAAIGALFVLLAARVVTSTAFYFRSEEKRVEAEEAKTDAILAQEKEADQRRKAEEAEREATRAKEQEAIASIANVEECPAYKGLVITPQIGLVPLGRDNPSGYRSRDYVRNPGLHPVEQVSWEDCQRVMRRLGLVLPTGEVTTRESPCN